MTSRSSGKKGITKKLMRFIVVGNSLLLSAVWLAFICLQMIQGRVDQQDPAPPLMVGVLVLLSAACGVAALSLLLSRRIQRLISDPIVQLTQKMELVSRSKDYMVRVKSSGDDELALLFNCFNDMLIEISTREERLAMHSEELEVEVEQRTRELSVLNRQLGDTLDEVRRAMQAAESANRAKSEFLAQMSHEIRTPLYGVLGMTELLQNTELTRKQARYVERMRQSGEALLTIINDILDFSKIEAGRMELEAIPFDLHELVAATVEMFSEDADRKGLDLSFEIETDVPNCYKGDPCRLRQVMINLIGNALKFTQEGSVKVRMLSEGRKLRLEVSDTGIGIPEDKQARIFNKFSQADESMTRKYGGTGLGLAIVKQLAELMAGELTVASEPGRGSTFSFTAALEPMPEHDSMWPERICRDLLRGKRVLVASDAAVTRASMVSQLTGWGMNVECVQDAAGAVEIITTASFELAIVDHKLSGTDGIELAATIRSMPAGRAMRLMLLAESDAGALSERAQQIGAFIFFKKSLRQHGLYWALLRVLGMEQSDDERQERLTDAPLVLLVEDNAVNQEISQVMLETLGCKVELADNGLRAIEKVQRTPYDLVFMDCEMPELDGLEATRRIRTWEENSAAVSRSPHPRTTIISLTAYAMREDRAACLASGADDYLSKPFTRDELSVMINRHLRMPLSQAPALQTPKPPPEREVISREKMSGMLEMIRTLPGNRGMEVLRKVIDLYLDSTPKLLQTMREAESGRDAEKLKVAAHTCKSSSANLGAMKLAGVCLELETLGRAGSTEGALPLLMKVEEEYQLVRDALQGGIYAE